MQNKLNHFPKAKRIFDGVPRTINQAMTLEKLLHDIKQKIDTVIFIDVSEKDLAERITTRYSCSKCGHIYNKFIIPKSSGECNCCKSHDFLHRADDNLTALQTRLKTYNELTTPLINYYQEKGIFCNICGLQDVDSIFQQIKEIVTPLLSVENTHVKEG